MVTGSLSILGLITRSIELCNICMNLIKHPFPLSATIGLVHTAMFTSLCLFKQIECPEGLHCQVPTCLFTQLPQGTRQSPSIKHNDIKLAENLDFVNLTSKKRKHDPDNGNQNQSAPTSSVAACVPQASCAKQRVNLAATVCNVQKLKQASIVAPLDKVDWKVPDRPKDLVAVEDVSKITKISLSPRTLHRSPTTYAIRMKLIAMLHEQLTRLNNELKRDRLQQQSAPPLSPTEVVTQALDEEERVAKNSPSVYMNVTKLRIMKLRKMGIEEWVRERQTPSLHKTSVTAATEPITINSGAQPYLSPAGELALLATLIADQAVLDRQGYLMKQISDADIAEARLGVEAAQGWEQCDRCGTRFQVFPGRRTSDGAMTSGGCCVYHPCKPRRSKSPHLTGGFVQDMTFACCNETLGHSAGCTTASTHVFKISETKRLASIMPFKATPPNPSKQTHKAICLDCEMGYTTCGLELIRLTATSWFQGTPLVDVLVRPSGEILDLNSRFSGVSMQDFTNAFPYEANCTNVQDQHMMMVKSLSAARELLFSYLTPEMPLIGHALNNDLNATRIIHPSIVDTALLYPHPQGFPLRLSLKTLTKRYLHRDIQMEHTLGHDSVEDANAAGDLVHMYITQNRLRIENAGQKYENHILVNPN